MSSGTYIFRSLNTTSDHSDDECFKVQNPAVNQKSVSETRTCSWSWQCSKYDGCVSPWRQSQRNQPVTLVRTCRVCETWKRWNQRAVCASKCTSRLQSEGCHGARDPAHADADTAVLSVIVYSALKASFECETERSFSLTDLQSVYWPVPYQV